MPYSRVTRDAALDLYRAGFSAASVSEVLGVHGNTILGWVRVAGIRRPEKVQTPYVKGVGIVRRRVGEVEISEAAMAHMRETLTHRSACKENRPVGQWRRHAGKCLHCGVDFKGVKDQRFCSNRCAGLHRFKNVPRRPRAPWLSKVSCVICGGEFLGDRKRKYCSPECREKRLARACVKCGGMFVPPKSSRKHTRSARITCSDECLAAARQRVRRMPKRSFRPRRKCVVCRSEFSVPKEYPERVYCSRACKTGRDDVATPLTPDIVQKALDLTNNGVTYSAAARQLGATKGQIAGIVHRHRRSRNDADSMRGCWPRHKGPCAQDCQKRA